VLVAYGLQAGIVTRPFLLLGQHLGSYRDVTMPSAAVILAGFLLHAAWIIAWCVAFALVAFDARPRDRVLLAVTVVAVAWLSSSGIMGRALDFSGIGGARWVFLHIVFAIAMYKGTRFANS
jgi:hypothetical protein